MTDVANKHSALHFGNNWTSVRVSKIAHLKKAAYEIRILIVYQPKY